MINLNNAIETGVPNMSILTKVNVKSILTLPEIPCQRDHNIRVTKMNKIFVNDTKMMHQFVVFNVVKNIWIIYLTINTNY